MNYCGYNRQQKTENKCPEKTIYFNSGNKFICQKNHNNIYYQKKRPKVIMGRGTVKIITNGLTNALRSASTREKIMAVLNDFIITCGAKSLDNMSLSKGGKKRYLSATCQ
jgi:hypothetical protein